MILEGTYPTQGEYPDSSQEYRGSAKVSISINPDFQLGIGEPLEEEIFIENLYALSVGQRGSKVLGSH